MSWNNSGQRGRRGFSLVELVIVIIIIGIIAAIAIPRVSRASKGAGESALTSNLSVLRHAIEIYAAEHDGDYPGAKGDGVNAANTAAAFESQLMQYSKVDGTTKATRDPANGFIYGPYLRKGIPPLSVGTNRGKNTVAIDILNAPPAATVATGEGWVCNPTTGDIIGNADDNNDAGNKTYDQY